MDNFDFFYITVFLLVIIYVIYCLMSMYNSYSINNKYSANRYYVKETKIPKRIFQIWKTWDVKYDNYKYDHLIKNIKKINPEYEHVFFKDNEIDTFLYNNYPDYYKTYLRLPIKIQKLDFFRYVLLYHYGGIYLDLDMDVKTKFDEILKYECVLPIEQTINDCHADRFKFACGYKSNFLLSNYAFACEKNCKFVKQLIDNIHNNIDEIIENSNYIEKDMNNNFVYETTGPDYITKEYLDYIDNNGDNNILLLNNPKNDDHVFGIYAKHLYFGDWK